MIPVPADGPSDGRKERGKMWYNNDTMTVREIINTNEYQSVDLPLHLKEEGKGCDLSRRWLN